MAQVTPGKNRPNAESGFKQQKMSAWQPTMSAPWVISCFFFLAVIFLPVGGAIIAVSDSVIEIKVRYDGLGSCTAGETTSQRMPSEFPNGGPMCGAVAAQFTVDKTMKAPIYLYYELENFYQNHRKYVASKSNLQLTGDTRTGAQLGPSCDPFRNPTQYPGASASGPVKFDDTPRSTVRQSEDIVYNPCGLIAWSMFNDTINLEQVSSNGQRTGAPICAGERFDAHGNKDPGTNANCRKQGIQWPGDSAVKFKEADINDPRQLTAAGWPNAPASSDGTALPLNAFTAGGFYFNEMDHKIPNATDLDFMVWMRVSSFSTFRKLYRIIDTDLAPGSYRFYVAQRFPVSLFEGKKYAVLTTSGALGGKNFFLGGLYLVVGAICLLMSCAFAGYYFMRMRGTRVGGGGF